MNNEIKNNESVKTINLFLLIVVLILVISGSTFAFFAFSATNDVIGGNAGSVNLTLTVEKVLPDADNNPDDILIANFSELPDNLDNNCTDGEYALCQVYKINLANAATGVNTNVKGSLSFDNTNVPNLSWVYLGNTYSSANIPNTFNTASSTYTDFINGYLLTAGTNKDFYILVWVNESLEEQTDNGTYTGTVRFEDSNGKGVTSTFTSN